VKRRWKFGVSVLACLGVLSLCTAALAGKDSSIMSKVEKAATAAIKAVMEEEGHPKVSEQEKLIPCFECHKDATPEIVQEWFDSRHGIANVKCYQCHGTFEDMEKVPSDDRCYVCHADAKNHTEPGKACWKCHPAHKFPLNKK